MKTIILDTGPLGMVSNPKSSEENQACRSWLEDRIKTGHHVLVPEIADYELRRELLRADKVAGLHRLDAVEAALGYVPITTVAMHRAAELWSTARKQGQPTAHDTALDGDVILAAQALTLGVANEDLIVATANVGHLDRFIAASPWHDII